MTSRNIAGVYAKVSAVTATTLTLEGSSLTATTGTGKIHGARVHYNEE